MKRFFISGTDTGVGKTYVGMALIHLMQMLGKTVQVRKPVETGCIENEGNLFAKDADLLNSVLSNPERLDVVCPYRFGQVCSPERASEMDNQFLLLDDLHACCHMDLKSNQCLFVEGAGGLYSPIAQGALNIDLAVKLNALIFLVAVNQLGVVHQVLSCLYAAKFYDVKVGAVFLNRSHQGVDFLDNERVLSDYLKMDCPVISLPDCNSLDEMFDFCQQDRIVDLLLSEVR